MKGMDFSSVAARAAKSGLRVKTLSKYQCQILGGARNPILNVWPNSKKGFRFQAGVEKARSGTVEDAIRLAGEAVVDPQSLAVVMRRISKKTAARYDECRDFRRELVAEVGHCELCQHDPERVPPGQIRWSLQVHEIARGPLRQLAMDKRFAVLVLCFNCHFNRIHGNEHWPEARQLAVLKRSRPTDYNLKAYNELVGYGPERITDADVERADIEEPEPRL